MLHLRSLTVLILFVACTLPATAAEKPSWPQAMLALRAKAAAQPSYVSVEQSYPIEMDWFLQDTGPDFARWLEAADTRIEQGILQKVIDQLGENGAPYRLRLSQLMAAKAPATDPNWLIVYAHAAQARRDLRLKSLATKYPRIVFTKHHNMGGSHYAYTEALSDAQAERTFRAGTALCVMEFEGTTPKVRTLIEDAKGVIRDPDVSYDGQRILFAWKKDDRKDDYHLYEMDVASGKVRQLTEGLGHADYEGQYVPSGDIIFNSTRCVQTVDCFTTEVSNLYTCDKDGKYLRRLCFDQVHTNFPSVLEDGRVAYTRWEYNDRGQVYVQGLMQMNPDGTGQTEFYGMNSWFPTTILHARSIPGSHKLVAIATGHHSRQTGKLITIDNTIGQQEASGVQLIAPVRKTQAVKVDSYGQEGELFQYPYALDDRSFLVTYSPFGWSKKPTIFGVYWMDIDGQRELLAFDPANSCSQSIPLAARKRPPVRPNTVDYAKGTATVYMQDVYTGQLMESVPRGTIKKLRIIGLDYRVSLIGGNGNGGPAGGAFVSTPVAIGNGAWDPKIVIGDATVRPDGSAFFEVPARVPVYFQALDEKGYMVQSMRSWTTFQPGENASCVGCHETKSTSPLSPQRGHYAIAGKAEKLAPFYGPPRGFSFPKEVQPILNKHCVSCHDNRQAVIPAGPSITLANSEKILPLESDWQYTIENPGPNWEKPSFDSSKWQTGKAGFGTRGTPGGVVNTQWRTPEIWIRRTVDLPADIASRKLFVWCAHDEDIEVYFNGEMGVCESGHISQQRAFDITKKALDTLKPGKNTIAVRCRQTAGGQYIDISLLASIPAKTVVQAIKPSDKPFSLLATDNLDKKAKRKWSDAYIALTASKYDPEKETRGNPDGPLVKWIHAQSAPPVQPPYFTGAARSRLMDILEKGHYDCKLSRQDMEKIACWIDLAVPYCGDYTEANAWDEGDWQRHNKMVLKRKAQEELDRANIEKLIREKQTPRAQKD